MPVSGGAAPVVVAVDIGGTFTDGVLVDDQARVLAAKVLSTPDDPSGGFFHALEVLMQQSGLAAAGMRAIGHATTVATNAIIEGKLRPTAMITTAGFRDILEIGRQVRPQLYDFFAVGYKAGPNKGGGQAAYYGIVSEGADHAIVTVRIRVENRKLTEAEWYLARANDPGLNGPRQPGRHRWPGRRSRPMARSPPRTVRPRRRPSPGPAGRRRSPAARRRSPCRGSP